MKLTDGRITLRSPVEGDHESLVDAIRSSLAELAPVMSWAAPETYDPAGTMNWIRGDSGNEVPFVIVDPDGEIVGACGLNRFDTENDNANLGYWVRTSATGNGYAAAATLLLARHGFDVLGLARIHLLIAVHNPASCRVAERAGATYEGRLRRRLRIRDVHVDAHMYSFVRDDFAD